MEPSGSRSSENSTTRAGGPEGMDELIGKLNLNEREEDDLNFDEEFPDEGDAAEFMAIARVHTNKPFSRGAFYENMRMAWSLAQGVTFSALGENLFSITVDCMGDWKRIMEEGPWLFRDHAVLIESYDGFTKFDEIVLDQLEVWIQVLDLPPMYRKETVIRSLTKKIGTVVKVMLNPRWGNGRIVRVRVKLDVNEPLMRFVSITKNQKKVYYSILYEKMPVFCYVCGHMGHTYLEHGNGKHDKASMAWGDWILAPRPGSQGHLPRQGTKGMHQANPQGRSDGDSASDVDLKDDASSPLKASGGIVVEGDRSRKRLTYEVPKAASRERLALGGPSIVGNVQLEFLDHDSKGEDGDDEDASSQDSKRSKTGSKATMDASHQISASSEKELDRTQ